MTTWVKPQRLDYLPLNDRLAVLRVSAQLNCNVWPRYPGLVVGAPHASHRTLALGSVSHPVARRRAADELLWRVTFAVPLDLVTCPQALFGLVAAGYSPTRLPDPWLATLQTLSEPWPAGDRYTGFIGAALARRAAALGTAVAVAGSGFASPVTALAAGKLPAHPARAVVLAPRQVPEQTHPSPSPAPRRAAASAPAVPPAPAARPDVAPAGPAPAAHALSHSAHHIAPRSIDRARPASGPHRNAPSERSVSHSASRAAPTHPRPSRVVPTHPRSESVVHPRPTAAVRPTARDWAVPVVEHHHVGSGVRHQGLGHPAFGFDSSGLSGLSTQAPAGLSGHGDLHRGEHHGHQRHSHHHHGPGGGGHGRHVHSSGRAGHGGHGHPSGGGGLPKAHPQPPAVSPPAPRTPDEPETTPSSSSAPSSPSSSAGSFWSGLSAAEAALLSHMTGRFSSLKPPAFLIPIYQKAGARYHIPWSVLAAINSIESDYGRDLNVSPAGAVGWMQFMPATWAQYGLAINHSGPPNPYNPTDAIFSAARYLAANGGGKHLRQAIFAYNHATWYVDEVLWRAGVIGALAHGHAARGFANPFPGGWVPNRLDMGYDGTFGHMLAAPVSGTITYAAQSFSNWGGYVELRADHRITGLPTSTFYFAEGLRPLFPAGTHVTAGTPIATAAPSPYGDAYNTTGAGRGQIEWGLAAPGPTGVPTNPLAETGIAKPARMVAAFAIWAVEQLGVAPPSSTNHAGYP